ncbi:hypothetical protein, partial [Streptomyces sp. SID2119]|uniref:hypothetical protein n=1 Tax=Streptomyces sp. SID2119 TaxID=2690253 RepID=UPI0019263AFC
MRSLRRLRGPLLPPGRIHRTLQIGLACRVVLATRLTARLSLRRCGGGRSTRLGLRGRRLLPPVLLSGRAGLRGIGLLRGLGSARLISPVRRLGLLLSGVGLLTRHRLGLVSLLTGVTLLVVLAGVRLLRRVGLAG